MVGGGGYLCEGCGRPVAAADVLARGVMRGEPPRDHECHAVLRGGGTSYCGPVVKLPDTPEATP